jgi:hypothetical protein
LTHESSTPVERLKQALDDAEIASVHFNGFTCSLGPGDVLIVLEQNGRPVQLLNASYTVAKTLAQKLSQLVAQLEDKTGNTIMTTEEVGKALGHEHDDSE